MEQEEIFSSIVENNSEALDDITTGLMQHEGGNKEKILVLTTKSGDDIILTQDDLKDLLKAVEND